LDLAIHITPDRLAAVLDLPVGRHVDLDTLRQLLVRANIRHGLSHDELDAATRSVAEDRSLVIARGDPPQAGEAGALVPALADGTAVVAGQALGRWQPPGPGVPGIGIDGQPLPPPAAPAGVGAGLALAADGRVSALRDGVLGRDAEGRPAVLLGAGIVERLVAAPQVQVDGKALLAWLDLEAGEHARPAAVAAALAAAGVVHGLDHVALEAAAAATAGRRRVVLAQATPARDGGDGRIESLIAEGVHLATDAHGRVDWHELGLIHEVAPGQAVARVVPADAGTAGCDVRGGAIAPKPGREPEVEKTLGEGVRLRAGDATVIEAARPGIYAHSRRGRIDIQPLLVIDGDVDLAHGNIDTSLAVVVKGDIRAGFSVKSAGDIEVHGVIEDARVSARGNLLVKGGILAGTRRVKAQGDVHARYIQGREVKGHDITVGGSIRSSSVFATGTVNAKEIAASRVIAGGSVACDTLGADDQSRTTVQAGINPFEETLAALARQQHEGLAREVATLQERCKLLTHHLATAADESGDGARALQEASRALAEASEQLTRGESVIARHDQMLADPARAQPVATITVRGTAHAGAEVLLGEHLRLVLPRDLPGPCFRVQEGAMVW
jgi:hypothetical protein